MTTHAQPSLAGLLEHSRDDAAGVPALRRLARQALIPLAIVSVLVAAWSASAAISGAVVAAGEIKVELNRKTVQHAEGGIVREILVRDGQSVRAGDALVVIGDVRSQAELAMLQDQWRAARARAARAESESRAAAAFNLPAELTAEPQAAEHIARERAVFHARRQALDEQVGLLQEQVRQAEAQAAALEAQIAATSRSSELSDEELAINQKLAGDGFVSRARLIGLQRVSADYASRLAEHRSELAAARQRAGELRTRISQLRLQQQTQATDELRDAMAQVRELGERLRPSLDHVERQTVRAPVDGTVMALRVAAAGAVVGPREALLDLVPAKEKLVVGVRVAPQDVEHVRVGSAADVRLLGDMRRRPLLPGKVVFVSADRLSDPSQNRSWFEVTIEVDRATLGGEHRSLELQPGMPAEVYIATGARTLIDYLLEPLGLFALRAMREP